LRQHISTILNTAALSEMDQGIQRSAELANQMLNGVDKHENGEIEPATDDCGVLVAYESTYHMADMPLLPVTGIPLQTSSAISETATSQTATPSSPFIVTPTKQLNPNPVPATVAPTNQPPAPTNNEPRPTKKPKPTEKPNPQPTKKKP